MKVGKYLDQLNDYQLLKKCSMNFVMLVVEVSGDNCHSKALFIFALQLLS
jgi:hypothetical protein